MAASFTFCPPSSVGRDSSVDIATRYGLDGPGIEYRWGRDFPHPSRPVLGSNQPPVQWVPGFFPGGYSGRGVALTTPSRIGVKEREEPYLYSTSLFVFMASYGVTFALTFYQSATCNPIYWKDDKWINKITDGALCDVVHGFNQGVLYFRKVIRSDDTRKKVV